MTHSSPFLVPPYTALAKVYERAGLADYAAQATPQYLAAVQSLDWAGRRILDLGCGTGTSAFWLVEIGYRVVGLDNNAAMLSQAHARAAQTAFDPPEFVQADMRQFTSPGGQVDLVIATNGVMNAVTNLRELEQTFASVSQALGAKQYFIFDVHTIRGLAGSLASSHEVTFDNQDDLVITLQSRFSFETLSATNHYTIWQRDEEAWARHDELHVDRGYPVQGITAMLDRTGFDVRETLNDRMESFDAVVATPDRAVIIAQKRA